MGNLNNSTKKSSFTNPNFENIQEKIKFAKEIGKGNFNYELPLSGEDDQLGISLINMANSLKESKEKINSLINFQNAILDSTEQSIITRDKSGFITHMNKGAEKMLGYSLEELMGMKTPNAFHIESQIINRAKVLSKELNTKIEPDFNAFVAKANLVGIDRNEWTFVKKDGTTITVDLIVTPIKNEKNEISGYTFVGSDISQSKKNLKEITLLRNALNDTAVVSITNSKGIIEHVNDKFLIASKYTREELIGQNHRILNSGHHPRSFFKKLWETIGKGKIFRGELVNRTKTGELYWEDSTIVPVMNEQNKPIQYISIKQDITKRKQFEKELIESKELAEKLAKVKDEFLSSMSHEIRTPLNGIIGFTNLLIQNPAFPVDQRKQLESIKTSGDILLVIINDILDLAKMDAGKMSLEEISFDLKELVDLIINTFAVKINEKRLNVHLVFHENVPQLVLGDSVRISQILFNFISNAIKFTSPEGNITLEISLNKEEDEYSFIQISVQDSGIGIQPDKVNTVFEPFVQTSNDTSRKYGGTGLGLAIVKKITELMSGTASVESIYGIGSKFTVILPLKKDDTHQSEKIEEPESLEMTSLKNIKVLLVEDNFINQLLAQTVLSQFEAMVTTVENGKLGVEAIEKEDFDIVLMDIIMPEMDGYEATIAIRNLADKSKNSIPIIAVTADVTNTVILKCKESGIDDYISKPFNIYDLYTKILCLVKINK